MEGRLVRRTPQSQQTLKRHECRAPLQVAALQGDGFSPRR